MVGGAGLKLCDAGEARPNALAGCVRLHETDPSPGDRRRVVHADERRQPRRRLPSTHQTENRPPAASRQPDAPDRPAMVFMGQLASGLLDQPPDKVEAMAVRRGLA